MKHSLKTGFSFGLTSGIITTLGIIVGLQSTINSRLVVIGGVLTIAIADALSDALGIHMSEESENKHTAQEIWEATFSTLISKSVFSLTFLVPVILLPLTTAVLVSLFWGFFLISIFSYATAKKNQQKPWKCIAEHVILALCVVLITHYVGLWVSTTFG